MEEERTQSPTIRVASAGTSGLIDETTPNGLNVSFEDYPRAHVERMLRSIGGVQPEYGDDPWPTFADGLMAHRVVDAVERSATRGVWVVVT